MDAVRVQDDFVSNVEALVAHASGADYRRYGTSPVLRAEIPPPPSVMDSLYRLVGFTPGFCHTRLHFNPAKDRSRLYIHPDPTPYSGVLYLKSPRWCGTTFFRHRHTGLKALPDTATLAWMAMERGEDPMEWAAMLARDCHREECWEAWLRVPAKPNRFVCYPGNWFHGPSSAWGETPAEGRTLLAVFFGE